MRILHLEVRRCYECPHLSVAKATEWGMLRCRAKSIKGRVINGLDRRVITKRQFPDWCPLPNPAHWLRQSAGKKETQ